MNTVTELLQPVENDLDDLILELKNLIVLVIQFFKLQQNTFLVLGEKGLDLELFY